MMYAWVISDTHFFHDNIVKYAGRPENHVDLMVRNWKEVVKPEDTVLHLGDVLMGPKAKWQELPRLPGKVSVLSTGNHDEDHKREFITREWGWKFVREFGIRYRGWDIFFSHYPAGDPLAFFKVLPEHSINVHGHIHEKPDPSPYHVNVSVERIHYRPVYLRDMLDSRITTLEKS